MEKIVLTKDELATLEPVVFPHLENDHTWSNHRKPALLIVPGGSYNYCSVREAYPVAYTFLQKGYQCFILNYHVGEESEYPRPIMDLALAVSHLRKNYKKYGIDRNDISVIGFSAGGHLAGVYSSIYFDKDFLELMDMTEDDTAIKASILAYPAINLDYVYEDVRVNNYYDKVGKLFRTYGEEKDGMKLVNARTSPTFIFHTLDDELVDVRGVIDYAKKLVEEGVETEFHLFSEGKHGLSTSDELSNYGRDYPKRINAWVDLSLAFLDSLRR